MEKKSYKYELHLGVDSLEGEMSVCGIFEGKTISMDNFNKEQLNIYWVMTQSMLKALFDLAGKNHSEISK